MIFTKHLTFHLAKWCYSDVGVSGTCAVPSNPSQISSTCSYSLQFCPQYYVLLGHFDPTPVTIELHVSDYYTHRVSMNIT